MSKDDAGHRLHFQVLQAFLLLLGEIPNLLLRKFDILDIALRDFRYGGPNFVFAQTKLCRGIAVEFLRQLTHGGVAALFDIGQDTLNDPPHLGVGFRDIGIALALFQIGDHPRLPHLLNGFSIRLCRFRNHSPARAIELLFVSLTPP